MTNRDDAWNQIIMHIVTAGKFRISDLDYKDENKATYRRVLREMERRDWLYCTSQQSPIWRAGDKAGFVLNIPEEPLEAADEGVDNPQEYM
ncbi:MAG: hypothetical protein ABEI52_03020 [Halobacteriaceae archaeon]